MFTRPILMTEEGSSPGGGSPPPVESPAAPQGAPATAAQPDIPALIAQQFADMKNAIFADLRRSGALGKDKPAQASPPVPAPAPADPAAQPGTSGMTAAEVQSLMARERAFTRAIASAGLSPDQEAYVESTFRAVNPPDPHEWASTFIKVMGIGAKQPVPTQAPPTSAAPPPAAPPAPASNFSDKGPAASSAARDPMAILQNDPRKATMDDFRRLVSQHGQAKALRMWSDNVLGFLQTVKVRPDGRR
jgi:hypothetical protein